MRCWLLFFTLLEVYHPLLFDVIPHPSVSYHQICPYSHLSSLHFQAGSSQSDLLSFHFNFSRLFILQYALRFSAGAFYPQAFFTLYTFPIFWVICDSYATRNTPSRIFLHPGSSASAWL